MTENNPNYNINDVLQPIDIDLDKLFSLSYTFDNLKSFMKNIVKNQQIIADKINELENKSTQQKEENKKYQYYQNNFERRLKSIEINNAKAKKEMQNAKAKKEEESMKNENAENKDVTEGDKEKEKGVKKEKRESMKDLTSSALAHRLTEKKLTRYSQMSQLDRENDLSYDEEYNPNELFASSHEIQEIREKIENLEKDLEKLKNEKKNEILKPNDFLIDENNGQIEMMKLEIRNLKQKSETYKIESDTMKKKMEEISVKVMDFNIYDLFKENTVGGGSIDAAKILIKNLEQKFTQKNEIIDEKMKKNEEDIYKLKNDFQNVKNESDVIAHNLDNFKSKIKELVEQVGKSNDNNSNLVNEMGNKVTENYKKILQRIEEEKNNTKKNFEKVKKQLKILSNKENSDDDKDKINGMGLSDEDLKIMSDLTKRVNEAEKTISKLITNSFDLSKMKEDLMKLTSELTQKIDRKEFFELSDKVNLQQTMTNNIRDMIDRVQDISNKNMKDLSFFLNKIESLSATVLAMKEALETLSGMKQDNILDEAQFLDIASFQEYLKKYSKDKEKLERNVDEIRRLFKDIAEAFNKKADGEDMKNFELLMNNKIEELKLMSSKKFADKIDTGKTMKYLDSQIRYITEVFIKKNDRNDNWLIAKKPIGGHACASCEAYIGDLKDKEDFVAWNKYPQREKEKNYRVGNGFSRMLNMLNMDIKNTFDGLKENNYESDDESKFYESGRLKTSPANFNLNNASNTNNNISNNNNSKAKKNFNRSTFNNFDKNALPKINNKSRDEGTSDEHNNKYNNMSTMQMGNTAGHIKYKDDNEPHIVKVFRKNK